MSKQEFIQSKIDNLTIEQKVGQVMVADFNGLTITPHLKKMIQEYNCAGLRVQDNIRYKEVYRVGAEDEAFVKSRTHRDAKGPSKDFKYARPKPACSPSEYAATLNKVKELSLDREHKIPIHIALDQEGYGLDNFTAASVRLFPAPMGMSATADTQLVYDAYKVFARQLKTVGFNWIHSPVLDVNTNPLNEEVGIRSFGDNPETVSLYAKECLRAFQEEKLIATAKHFPGRGESVKDAHFDLPVIDLEREKLIQNHITPYKELIKQGLPAVMIAHTVYTALEKQDIPATVSHSIVTEFLRNELDFDGAITSDNMLMSGLVKRYTALEGAILALKAGITLLLLRTESPLWDEVYHGIVDAVKNNDLDENVLDKAIYHNLSVKYDYGIFEDGGIVDPAKADDFQKDESTRAVEIKAAQSSIVVMRDQEKLLPVSKDKKVLLIDQISPVQKNVNTYYCHSGIFWEQMLQHSDNVYSTELDGYLKPTEEEIERILKRTEEVDIVVAANFEVNRHKKHNTELIEAIIETGKPVIVVSNSPFRVSDKIKNIIVIFTDATQSIKAAADVIYGKLQAKTKLPIDKY